MSIEVEPGDWTCLDSWWSTYTQATSIARSPASPRVFGMGELADSWDELDSWWSAYTETAPAVQGSVSPEVLGREELADYWDDLDPWWEIYTETGHETAEKIAELLNQSNDKWEQSDGPFDTDPLAADLTKVRFSRGPLQPGKEKEWSKWLAQLLRQSLELMSEVFGVESTETPNEVSREDRIPKEKEGFRRPDILVFYGDRGVSIEVKLDDKNYEKTADTAALVEDEHPDHEWRHALLLPEENRSWLNSKVGDPAAKGPDRQIEWDDLGTVDIIYWRDVTSAIRSLLRRDAVVDDHWAANAYLFCAVAEQQQHMMGFQPQSVIQDMAAPVDVVKSIRPIQLADTLEQQLTYLRERIDS